jgi:hypothetical protein
MIEEDNGIKKVLRIELESKVTGILTLHLSKEVYHQLSSILF